MKSIVFYFCYDVNFMLYSHFTNQRPCQNEKYSTLHPKVLPPRRFAGFLPSGLRFCQKCQDWAGNDAGAVSR